MRIAILIWLFAVSMLPEWSSAAEVVKPRESKPPADYRVQPEDEIVISVVGEPELQNNQFKVTTGGTVSYPYLRELKVAGKTPAEIEDMIRVLLDRDYIIDPQVVISIKKYRPRTITVLGEVMSPGVFDLPVDQKIDAIQAIAMAKGFSKVASKSKIEITRDGRTHKFNMDELKSIKDSEKKFWLMHGDVVLVGESIF